MFAGKVSTSRNNISRMFCPNVLKMLPGNIVTMLHPSVM